MYMRCLFAWACALLFTGAAHAQSAPALGAAGSEGYRLVWSDEFDFDGAPDPDLWGFENGFVRNRELQWYQPENAHIEGGFLVIEARREYKPNPIFGAADQPRDFAQRRYINYTSASLTTKGKRSWLYGRLEVRARFPAQTGLWPAIWTLGEQGRWPANGEVDVLEYYDHSILANFAWAESEPNQPRWQSRKLALAQISDDPDWDKEFHTWRMDWDESEISLWLDGRIMNRIDLDTVHNTAATGVAHPFRQPHYLILNLALGGQHGGPVRDLQFPARYEIDYVRLYQKTDAAQ